MTDPIWISEQFALAVHERQLELHGGLSGVRDLGLLLSALARPRHIFSYSSPKSDLAQLAAAYAFGVAKNHPFVDGSKRTAAVILEAFLEFNGIELLANDSSFYEAMIGVASGTLSEAEFAEWIRQNIKPV